MSAYMLQNQEITSEECFRWDIFSIKELKNTGVASRVEYTHVMKKYVRLIKYSFFAFCRICNSSLFFIQAVLRKLPKLKYWRGHSLSTYSKNSKMRNEYASVSLEHHPPFLLILHMEWRLLIYLVRKVNATFFCYYLLLTLPLFWCIKQEWRKHEIWSISYDFWEVLLSLNSYAPWESFQKFIHYLCPTLFPDSFIFLSKKEETKGWTICYQCTRVTHIKKINSRINCNAIHCNVFFC